MKIILTFLMILFCAFSFAQNEFITLWKPSNPSNTSIFTPSTNTQIYFPGIGTNYNIYWEEVGNPSHNGSLKNVTSTDRKLIEFGTGITSNPLYIVKISTDSDTFSNMKGYNGDYEKLIEIRQWGNIRWKTMKAAFELCFNLDIPATDIPILSDTKDASFMFSGCRNLRGNPSFAFWDTSHFTTTSSMFNLCENFNQNIGNWNTSNVTDMHGMFFNATLFNQNIGNWDTSKVNDMVSMFNGATNFNQNIGNWDTSNVENMFLMFQSASMFNQNIGNWNTSKVINMDGMFNNAINFNQNIGNWNTASLVNASDMFRNASNFNQNIGNWNTSNVTDMSSMFYLASRFNQDIGNWNTSNVTNMGTMFASATKFNQNIGNWDTSKVENMNAIFGFATSFNQNLENWNLKNVKFVTQFFYFSNLSCENYDKTLIGWANNPNTPNNLQFIDNTNITYSSSQAVSARNYLINTKGWTISGDTYNPNCALSTNELQNKKIQVYPNPAKDFILVDNLKNNTEFEIYDIQGKLVKKQKYNNSQISLKNLSKGVYILKIPTESYSQKIIVE